MNPKFKYILLIDDDYATNFIHEGLLKKIGYGETTLSFQNGREAIDFISKSLRYNSKPVLILLDINMPIMNGWEFLDYFNGLPNKISQDITIAMVTSSPDPGDKALAKAKNIDHFLNKPLSKSAILELIKSTLKL